ncbi:farnesyl pyrophosphate synthase [Hydra vulgaris]|uniref:Farnesyl pyrophosphate synthase n=1 Tax=Hydra vulgaris TaxID=6087 RepID=A0ABM4B6J5_HYDVU
MDQTSYDLSSRILVYQEKFDLIFENIIKELVEIDAQNPQITEAAHSLRDALSYNAFDGKKSRGMMVICSLDFLKNGNVTNSEVDKALCLGWCVEILQAVFLVADDIMDRSEIRRGKPCWYKKCGLRAINDTYLMEQCIYALIDKHFMNEPYLVDLYKSFHRITYLTAMGQELDMLASEPNGNFTIRNFTEDKYKSIVKYKTAYYSFYLPVSLGMILANIKDMKMYAEVENILMKLGELFQIQDDYLDCYGDPAKIGKVGRDIEDGKCSWLIVQALTLASTEELLLLESNYGNENPTCVKIVKDLYVKLGLKEVFKKFEEECYTELLMLINKYENDFPKGLFLILLQKIYKRDK